MTGGDDFPSCPPAGCVCGFFCREIAVCRCPDGCACERENGNERGQPARVCEHHATVCRFRDDERPVTMASRRKASRPPRRTARKLPGWYGSRGLYARR